MLSCRGFAPVEATPVASGCVGKVIQGGEVTQSGSYEELLTTGTAFEQLVNAHKNAATAMDPEINENTKNSSKGNIDRVEETKGHYLTKENSEGDTSVKGLSGVQLTEEEEKEIGNVGWKPIFDYIVIAKGLPILSLSILSHIGFLTLQAASSYWLAFAIQIPNISSGIFIGVYTIISTISAVFVYLRAYLTALLGLKPSKSFFSSFIDSIFTAPMLFFDSTPVGRILTRASSDLSTLDFDIPIAIAFVYASALEVLIIVIIMASVTWQVLIVAAFATVASSYVQVGILYSFCQGTDAAETSLGVGTIREFNMAERFFQNYLKLIDTDAKLFLYSNASLEWLNLRVEALQNLTLFTAAFLLIFLPKGGMAPGLVGLSLSYALVLTFALVFFTQWYSSLCNYIISVERIKQFMNIPPEPPAIVEDKRPPFSWPSEGKIELQDLKLHANARRSGFDEEGARVGVVGRTGSGKTTLISALFRLVEPESGKILIDALDICSIGLKDPRMKLSIIPQEPTLFKGSVRTNLDPSGLYSDDELWKALEKCQLKATISSLPNLLDSSGKYHSKSLSDEVRTGVQDREEFSGCTVITVAHRVPTVTDSDMVMVLSFGELVEYDEPSKLMETDSSFSKLVAEYWSSHRKN
ncbi:hypothetical protein RHSIM_Rhsim12G0042900 [Rhododendron simsii]|uniref:ABC-type xenobiotic transporter n=1 Tax=Rhododendron simsii TaxID=118357 RepID=A0A834G5E2_RHOSS|nr:hypothetical protein RHSIM_Rhsim12G0042900 [Rhododendron simsii]